MKTKKYRGGGQGYAAREDESLGMRTGAERTKRQSMRDRRDESYGAWGRRPNQMINRNKGGLGARAISDEDKRMVKLLLGEGSKNISADDRARARQIVDDFRKEASESHQPKEYARGGVERAGEEGSRLSVSMEKQEDAGFSPSEADFREQHKLALEGVMDVGADVTIVQGHDSREQLGETDGVRGVGEAIRGKNFQGVS